MTDKHFLYALIVLLLPLSFGVDTAAGTKTPEMIGASNTSHSASLKNAIPGLRGFTINDVPRRFGAIPSVYTADIGQPIATFVSSFDAPVRRADTDAARLEIDFPLYESFSGSDASAYSRSGGSVWPIGIGVGGGRGAAPLGTMPRNPNIPITTPEPGTFLMLACGLLTLAGLTRRRMLRATVHSN